MNKNNSRRQQYAHTRLSVRVNRLGYNTPVVLDVEHGQRRPAAVAALVPLRVARHQLLLGQLLERMSCQVPRALQAAGSAERPAGPAVRLCSVQNGIEEDGWTDENV